MSSNTIQYLAFKHFVAEGDPAVDEIIALKNNNTGKNLYCYLSTLNAILGACPVLLEKLKEYEAEGPDEELFEELIKSYGNKKVMGYVKRYRNRLGAFIQIMYDKEQDGNFKHSPFLVQISPEDELEKLRSFAQRIKNDHEVAAALLKLEPQL